MTIKWNYFIVLHSICYPIIYVMSISIFYYDEGIIFKFNEDCMNWFVHSSYCITTNHKTYLKHFLIWITKYENVICSSKSIYTQCILKQTNVYPDSCEKISIEALKYKL